MKESKKERKGGNMKEAKKEGRKEGGSKITKLN